MFLEVWSEYTPIAQDEQSCGEALLQPVRTNRRKLRSEFGRSRVEAPRLQTQDGLQIVVVDCRSRWISGRSLRRWIFRAHCERLPREQRHLSWGAHRLKHCPGK